eukprot:362776-Chlamydomonas_euryale.AAC.13
MPALTLPLWRCTRLIHVHTATPVPVAMQRSPERTFRPDKSQVEPHAPGGILKLWLLWLLCGLHTLQKELSLTLFVAVVVVAVWLTHTPEEVVVVIVVVVVVVVWLTHTPAGVVVVAVVVVVMWLTHSKTRCTL